MASFTKVLDTQVSVFHYVGNGPAIGVKSRWGTEDFPGVGNDIDGWHFDERRWGGVLDENEAHFVPVLWDPSTIGVADNIKTGIGDNNDLLVTSISLVEDDSDTVWRPRVLHGYYYAEDEEFYLYSDDGLIDYVTFSGVTASGLGNSLQLSRTPKAGIPINVTGYEWDESTGAYLPNGPVRARTQFTGQFTTSGELLAQDGNTIFWENINISEKEWFLDATTSPPTAIFNQQIAEQIGGYHTTVSGLTAAQVSRLDTVGISNGQESQFFHLKYSPIDTNSEVRFYSEFLDTDHRTYTTVEDFTFSGVDEVKIDYDLGIAEFGTVASGGVPPYGSTLMATYFKTVGIEYEPEDTRDYIEDVDADLNSVRRFTGDGFVFLRNRALDVSKLELSAVLPEISSDFFGPLLLGNSFASVQATALSKDDEVIEGQAINFEIIGVEIGSFGAAQSTEAITNGNGTATTLYNPPRTIEQLGGVTDSPIFTASGTDLFLEDYLPSSSTDTLFLFQVAREDLILGIPKAELIDYYTTYVTEDGSVGPELDISLGDGYEWVTGAIADQITWDIWHRTTHDLAVPATYEPEDLRTGKKSVISQFDTDAVNPHTGTTPAIVPIQPTTLELTDSGTNVSFDVTLSDITVSSPQRSYLVIGPTKVTMRATTVNERTGNLIISNTIEVLIDLPDASKGLLDIDAINSVPSGLLTRAEYYDQATIDLEEVSLTASGLLPVGFRLRSPGISLASALDGVTFLDLNPLNQSYTYSGVTTPSGLLVDLAHQFDVVI